MSVSDDHAVEKARAIRDGEELDQDTLFAYLRQHMSGLDTPEILQFPKGHSNLTYLIRDGMREYVLRRPPFGANIPTGHDMGREFRIL